MIKAERLDGAGAVLETVATQYTPTGQTARVVGPCLSGATSEAACPVTDTAYDALDRTLQTTDPEGRRTRFVYDAAGQITKEIRAYQYSAGSTDESCAVAGTLQQCYAQYGYTANGQQAWVQDAKGNRTDYAYDGYDRLARTQFPSKTTAGQSNPSDYESFGGACPGLDPGTPTAT